LTDPERSGSGAPSAEVLEEGADVEEVEVAVEVVVDLRVQESIHIEEVEFAVVAEVGWASFGSKADVQIQSDPTECGTIAEDQIRVGIPIDITD
jgi:hypothetical protein